MHCKYFILLFTMLDFKLFVSKKNVINDFALNAISLVHFVVVVFLSKLDVGNRKSVLEGKIFPSCVNC